MDLRLGHDGRRRRADLGRRGGARWEPDARARGAAAARTPHRGVRRTNGRAGHRLERRVVAQAIRSRPGDRGTGGSPRQPGLRSDRRDARLLQVPRRPAGVLDAPGAGVRDGRRAAREPAGHGASSRRPDHAGGPGPNRSQHGRRPDRAGHDRRTAAPDRTVPRAPLEPPGQEHDLPAGRRGGVRAAHRLRQHRQPAARPECQPLSRGRGPDRPRRATRHAHPSVHDRIAAARGARRSPRPARGAMGHQSARLERAARADVSSARTPLPSTRASWPSRLR